MDIFSKPLAIATEDPFVAAGLVVCGILLALMTLGLRERETDSKITSTTISQLQEQVRILSDRVGSLETSNAELQRHISKIEDEKRQAHSDRERATLQLMLAEQAFKQLRAAYEAVCSRLAELGHEPPRVSVPDWPDRNSLTDSEKRT